MSDESKKPFPIAKTIPISQAYSEKWLQEKIWENPSILGLGDLEIVIKERIQEKNGRLDMLLKDDDESMFEVELMLGETDEKHIIHTIEYWDNEQRKFPQRQHFPVLVAESFDGRFFNIIHLFSRTIPLIAIQVNLVEVAGVRALHFSKIIKDVYQEPEETEEFSYVKYDEAYWSEKFPWIVDSAKTLLEILKPIYPSGNLSYQSFVGIRVDGENRVKLYKRNAPKSRIRFWFTENLLPKANALLDSAEITPSQDAHHLNFTLDSNSLKKHQSTIVKVAEISKASWEE